MAHQAQAKHQMPTDVGEANLGSSEMSFSETGSFKVPTFAKKATNNIHLIELRKSDLSAIKENDPFLYYSIPSVRMAAMRGIDLAECPIDMVASLTKSSDPVKRSISFESSCNSDDMDTENDEDASLCSDMEENFIALCKVKRQSRISFESPDLFLPKDLHSYIDGMIEVPKKVDHESDEDEFSFSFLDNFMNLSFDQ